jgi:hypothetical protein
LVLGYGSVALSCYGENRVSVFWFSFLQRSEIGKPDVAPSLVVLGGTKLFFVRVNRFWCVWIRVLVFGSARVVQKIGPGFWQWVV